MKNKLDIEKALFIIKESGVCEITRKKDIVYRRMYAAKFLRNYTMLTLEKIGEHLGDKDHATILHYLKVCEDLKKDKLFLICTNEIANRLDECFENPYKKESLTWLESQILKCNSYQDLKKLQTKIIDKQADENYFEMEDLLFLR